MSKEKINAVDIVEILAQQLSFSKKNIDEFLKAFAYTIEEELLKKESIKIYELGTFKLQWNEPRKSVDVNTGEDIIIDGYHKVVFIPDIYLKELANEPFAHLQPIEIDSDNIAEEDNKDTEEHSVSTTDSLKYMDEQASEIKDLLSEIKALNETRSETDEVKVEVEIDEVGTDEVEVKINEVEIDIPDNIEETNENDTNKPDSIEDTNHNKIKSHSVDTEKRSSHQTDRKKKSPIKYKKVKFDLLFIIALVTGLLVYIVIDLDVTAILKGIIENKLDHQEIVEERDNLTNVHQPEITDINSDSETTTTVVSDEIPENNKATIKKEDDLERLFNQAREYKEFIAVEKVIPGSRLTRIAERHYGVKEFWVYIYEANRDILQTPNDISPGMEIKIPKLNPKIADVNNPKCIDYAIKLHDLYVK
ncbi:MAG: hypothetical protein BGO29_05970 [Bacteroidales bacterium 36-12]|nr:MAG: hypothetical protein BGO29_05970 [Bacteroidales bacterium 36-12]